MRGIRVRGCVARRIRERGSGPSAPDPLGFLAPTLGPPPINRPHNLRNPPDPRSATNRPASVFSDISLSWTKIADM